jgi:hypothetical protein
VDNIYLSVMPNLRAPIVSVWQCNWQTETISILTL